MDIFGTNAAQQQLVLPFIDLPPPYISSSRNIVNVYNNFFGRDGLRSFETLLVEYYANLCLELHQQVIRNIPSPLLQGEVGTENSSTTSARQSSIPHYLVQSFYEMHEQEMVSKRMHTEAKAALERFNGNETNDSRQSKEGLQTEFQGATLILQEAQNSTLEASLPILARVNNVLDNLHQQESHAMDSTGNHGNITNDATNENHSRRTTCPSIMTRLMMCVVITNATPKALAEYASQSETNYHRLNNLLQLQLVDANTATVEYSNNRNLMREMLHANGPMDDNYGQSLDIYHSITDNLKRDDAELFSTHFVLHRLALAMALEYCGSTQQTSHVIFDTNTPIDCIQRYHHYETAYLNGELDPLFHTLSTLDLRMVVDANASNEELFWCRAMIRNYRPDFILPTNGDKDNGYQWKYCQIVRSDVKYQTPAWKTFPKTYQQLLSGGGKCGPRAWMGRIACKAFGIPTWGVRQPGHAAMSHWMPYSDLQENSAWVICLGGPNWSKSHWPQRSGEDFIAEMTARRSQGMYERHVLCLQWMADAHQEAKLPSQTPAFKNRNAKQRNRFWSELAIAQTNILVQQQQQEAHALGLKSTGRTLKSQNNLHDTTQATSVKTLEERLHFLHHASSPRNPSTSHMTKTGALVVPAAGNNYRQPNNNNHKVKLMPSFLAVQEDIDDDDEECSCELAMQIHLQQNFSISYDVTVNHTNGFNKRMLSNSMDAGNSATIEAATVHYTLQLRIVTVHDNTAPIQLRIQPSSAIATTMSSLLGPFSTNREQQNFGNDERHGNYHQPYIIDIPNTAGEWQWTKPIVVSFRPPPPRTTSTDNKYSFTFYRDIEDAWGLSMACFKLEPKSYDS